MTEENVTSDISNEKKGKVKHESGIGCRGISVQNGELELFAERLIRYRETKITQSQAVRAEKMQI